MELAGVVDLGSLLTTVGVMLAVANGSIPAQTPVNMMWQDHVDLVLL